MRATTGRPPGVLRWLHRRWAWLALAGILLLHVGLNAICIDDDRSFRAFDMVPQLGTQIAVTRHLQLNGLAALPDILRGHPVWWPTAGYLPLAAVGAVAGSSPQQLRFYNLLYLALLLLAVFWIGRRMGGERAGILAAALTSLCPALWGASRLFGADYPGAAMVTLCVAALLPTDRLTRPGRSTLFGLAVGTAVLVRPHSLFFLAPVSLLEMVRGVRAGDGRTWRQALLGAALAGTTAAAISAVWWGGRVTTLLRYMRAHVTDTGLVALDHESTAGTSIGYYLRLLPEALSPVLTVAAAVGAVAVITHRLRGAPVDRGSSVSHTADPLLLLVWVTGGMTVVSLMATHQVRFMLPALPPLALIAALGLLRAPRGWIRRALLSATLVSGTAAWLTCSLARPPAPWGIAPLNSCGSDQLCLPPARSRLVLAAEELAAGIARNQPQGGGTLVWVDESPQQPAIHGSLGIVLLGRLPRLQVTSRSFEAYLHDPGRETGLWYAGASVMPRHREPVKRCIRVQLRPGAAGAVPVLGAAPCAAPLVHELCTVEETAVAVTICRLPCPQRPDPR